MDFHSRCGLPKTDFVPLIVGGRAFGVYVLLHAQTLAQFQAAGFPGLWARIVVLPKIRYTRQCLVLLPTALTPPRNFRSPQASEASLGQT